MKKKKSSFKKKINASLESDDFGFGSYLLPLKTNIKEKIKMSFCSVEGVVYHF